MKPLITIESVPISIEYVEKKTTHTSSQSASLHISKQDNRMTIKSNPIPISMDRFRSDSSSDWRNLTYTATARYSGDGNLSMSIQVGKSGEGNFRFDKVGRDMGNMMDFLPQAQAAPSAAQEASVRQGPQRSSEPFGDSFESLQIHFDMSRLALLPSGNSLDASFLPPDLELKVVEYPKVIIKYVGGPIYIPPSADPNYVPPEELPGGRPILGDFDGKTSNFDVKA